VVNINCMFRTIQLELLYVSNYSIGITVKNKKSHWQFLNMRAIWKVRGLTLLFRVGTLWRCGDSLFFEVPPLESDALLTTLHQLLENVLQTVDHFEISCLGAPFSWLEKPRNRMGRDLNWILCSPWKKWIGETPLQHPSYSPHIIFIGRSSCTALLITAWMFVAV
jgi:hypothetical protein